MTARRIRFELQDDRLPDPLGHQPSTMVCDSEAMQAIYRFADRAARTEAKVLITGESGVGKDVLARRIHAGSARASRPFIAINCAGVTETLLESEFFGHVKGAFTDAYRDRVGKLQLAESGTVFLDEIGEKSLRMQALLLRFLENKEIQPVGADNARARQVDVRVISTTNRNLASLVKDGQFREDLLYRIQVIHIVVPGLRDRQDDILPLIDHLSGQQGRSLEIDDAARTALTHYPWPGNVRQVQNVVEELLCRVDEQVTLEDLPEALRAMPAGLVRTVRERRRQVADVLFEGLINGDYQFWLDVREMFLGRQITTHDLRELVRRGLAKTCGSYRALLPLFGMKPTDYRRFLNFLSVHDVRVDFREFRDGSQQEVFTSEPRPIELPAPQILADGRTG